MSWPAITAHDLKAMDIKPEKVEIWDTVSGDELRDLQIGPPTPTLLKYRRELLKDITVNCIRCGDTVDSLFPYLKHKAAEFSLEISDYELRAYIQSAFDTYWSLPENKAKGGPYDFVLGPLGGADPKKGVFALGDVHLIQGASGSGKSSLAYHMLLDQRAGIEVFGRPTYERDFLVVMADRSANSLTRTLDSLNLEEDFPCRVLDEDEQHGKPADVLQQIWTQRQGVEIIFVEGLDLWQKKIMGTEDVGPLMTALQRFAQDRHVALIASVGSPKVKVKEGYKAPRDRAIGSSTWARKADDIIDIVEDHDSDGVRHVTLLPRTDKPQSWNARFVDGRLEALVPAIAISIDPVPKDEPREKQARALWQAGKGTAEIAAALGVAVRTVQRWIK